MKTLIRLCSATELVDAGFIVFEAAESAAAIAMIEANSSIRLIFSDIDMPGSMDGLKLVAAIRDRWPPLQIIVTSGLVEIADVDMPYGEKFFAKPCDGAAGGGRHPDDDRATVGPTMASHRTVTD